MKVALLRPKRIYKTIFDIPLEELYNCGLRGIIIDLDNTLTELNNPDLSKETVAWLKHALNIGFQLCFVSNNSKRRVQEMAGKVNVPFVARARKPRRRSFRNALKIMQTAPEETVVIGDQLFTDILGGNRLGLYTILVRPLSKREFFGTRLVRCIEKLFLPRLES